MANKPIHGNMIYEEGIDIARSYILEGLRWINEVSLHRKAHASAAVVNNMEFDNILDYMDKLWSNYHVLDREKIELMQENIDLSSTNKQWTLELAESARVRCNILFQEVS